MQAADRVDVLVLEVDAEQLAEVVDVQPWPLTRYAAVAEVLDLGGLAVVLVGDLADDLLEDVLDGDQARRCRRTRRRRWRRGSGSRCISRSRSSTGLLSGTNGVGRISSSTGTAPASGRRSSRRTTSLR